MILVSFSAALSSYRLSVSKSNEIFDRKLANYAQILNSVKEYKIINKDNNQAYAYQVWSGNNLVSQTINATNLPISELRQGFSDNNFNSQRWRTYSLIDAESDYRVIVAEPLSTRLELAEELAVTAMAPLVFSTLALAILISITITRSLTPLKTLSHKLKTKKVDDFTEITLKDCPAELRPVLITINRLARRVELAFEREKRFASDAAHELRTPISVLRVNIHNLLEQHPDLSEEIKPLQQGTQRMSHVVEQILLLNRTQPDHFKASFVSLDVTNLCQRAISENYDLISSKDQSIELIHLTETILGDEFALMSMLNNLVSNASKYTPNEGKILLSIESKEGQVFMIVEDSGPGIEEQEYLRVLDRFYRIQGDKHNSGIIGCGLGMAIVKQAVDLHHGTITLGRSDKLGGLKVNVGLAVSSLSSVNSL